MNKIYEFIKVELFKKPEKQKEEIGSKAGRLFITFFIMMFLFTILSRIADSMTIAKVETETIKQGTLNFSIKGSGTIEANAQNYMTIYPNIRIGDVYVNSGDKVEAGDRLFQYDLNSLQEKLDTLNEEIEKTEKNIKKLELNIQLEEKQSSIQGEVDTSALENAQGDLEEAQQRLEDAKTDFAKIKKKEYEEAQIDYYSALNDLNSLLADAAATQTEITAQKKIVAEAKISYENAQKIYGQIEKNTYDYSSDIRSYYQAVDSAEKAVEEENKALTEAQEEKVKSDANKNEIKNINKQIIRQDIDLSQIELDKAIKSANEIQELINANGIVSATTSATLLECDLQAGNITTGSEKLSFAGNEYYLEAQIPKESIKYISEGDMLELTIEDTQKILKIEVQRVESGVSEGSSQESSNSMVGIVGKIQESEYKVGESISFSIEKMSETYLQVIPIQSLFMESEDNYYVLVLENKDTVLGNETVVTKLAVNILEKDYKSAAIESSLTNESQIVITSNKNISAGDRVRVTNE